MFAGVLMLILLISYAGHKLEIMLNFGENIIQEPIIERYFDMSEVFDS